MPHNRRKFQPFIAPCQTPARLQPAFPAAPRTFTAAQCDYLARPLGLPPQQARIVALILRGMRDKQIAAEMRLCPSTVRDYLHCVFVRTGACDRAELVLHIFALHFQPKQGGAPPPHK